jgi:fructose-1,6-bisphosphatase/inositol monophosphatase family enzyme
MSPAPDPTELVDLATDVATTAAALLVGGLARARHSIETKTSVTDLVTDMDRASERTIVDGILAHRPHDAVVGEEGSDRSGTTGVRWIIDPIDGTTNYVYGHPGFAVSIAAEWTDAATGRAEALVGVVADPLHDEVFTAVAGGGAFRNGEPIRCSAATELRHALVATGFSYESERRFRQAGVLTQVLPAVRDIRRMGAASVDLCSVACGRVDAYYERGLKPWDFAAGALVAREAGALVTDLDGGDPSEAFTLAATPALSVPLARLLRDAGAADA